MKNKLCFAVLALVVLAIGIAAIGCVSVPKETSVSKALSVEGPPITPKLDELLRKYTAPRPDVDNNGKVVAYAYHLDPFRFDAFKAELDVADEYIEIRMVQQYRESIQGRHYAMWYVESNGNIWLDLRKEDNSMIGYEYKKDSGMSGTKTDELLRKYMGPYSEHWEGTGKGLTYIYYLDPLRFEVFKAELDVEGEYQQTGSWTENRDWGKGVTFAQWAVRPNGEFVLRICNADNSVIGYTYKKVR